MGRIHHNLRECYLVRFWTKVLFNFSFIFIRLPQVDYIFKNYGKKYLITVRELILNEPQNYRDHLMKAKYTTKNIVLCCSIESLPSIFKQAQQIGLFNGKHSFIVTTFDLHTIDLKPFQFGRTNVTGLRMISPHNPLVRAATDYFIESFIGENSQEVVDEDLAADKLHFENALIYDSGKDFSCFNSL